MAVLALPLIVGATREAPRAGPRSNARGLLRAGQDPGDDCIRHVLLPAIRPSIASGVVLGMGRIIGDTAIITILLGRTLKNAAVGSVPRHRRAARHRLDADQLRL